MRTVLACCFLVAAWCQPALGITLRELTNDSVAPSERVYKTAQGAELKLYLFQSERGKSGERLPAFVWIHGGGWTSGDARSGFPHARYFASRGMVAFSIEYRLVKAGGSSIGDSISDCRSAIAFIRDHALELGVDPRRIAVAGDSAGAHLAAALGNDANAMVLYNGIFDLTEYRQTREDANARAWSPMFHVHAGDPPAIVLHGLDDTVVSPEQSRRFAAVMKQAGNRCDLVLVEHANHAFVLPNYTAPEPVVVKAIRDGDAFLVSIGFLSGGPTLETLAPLPQPRAGWWAERHELILERVKHGEFDLVWIGDSITQNFEKANPPDENFAPTWDEFYGRRKALNLGYSGDTTGNVLWRIENGEIDGIRPKAVVILIGTNDSGHGATAEQASAGIDEIVRMVHVKCPLAKVLLLGILPSKVSAEKSKVDEAVNSYLARRYAADALVTYLDVGGIFERNGELDESLFYDPRLSTPRGPLHPDTVGQRKLAEAIEPALASLMR